MAKATRVHSTPPTNTSKSIAGAPRASSLCPASVIPASHTDARQALASEGEPHAAPPTCSDGAGAPMTRRILMNMMVRSAAIVAAPSIAQAASDADAELLDLEERIFEHHAAAKGYDTEIERLDAIVKSEGRRLYDEALAAEVRQGRYLTPDERWSSVGSIVSTMPEFRECSRLIDLQDAQWNAMDRLQQEMWATPAHGPEGRRSKVLVLLGAILDVEWQHTNDRTEFGVLQARNLLIEFIGGEPGKQMRDQFA
jgi:hypothetical protein